MFFWNTVKLILLYKVVDNDGINLTENGKLVKIKLKTIEDINNFFPNIWQNLVIHENNQTTKG